MFPPVWHTQSRLSRGAQGGNRLFGRVVTGPSGRTSRAGSPVASGPEVRGIEARGTASRVAGAPGADPSGPEAPSAGTLASAAHARVRAEILSGAIPPGSRIHIRALCARLGLGLSPVREALNRLSAQGLVVQSDQRGFTAAPLDLADLADLTLARAAVNAAALRDALAHGDAAWEESLLLAHHRLARTPRRAAVDPAWEARHAAFHAALLAGCRSGRLRLYAGQLFAMADRYRHLSRAPEGGPRATSRPSTPPSSTPPSPATPSAPSPCWRSTSAAPRRWCGRRCRIFGEGLREERKRLLFLKKKKQKDFCSVRSERAQRSEATGVKVFWFFFFRKEPLPCFLSCTRRREDQVVIRGPDSRPTHRAWPGVTGASPEVVRAAAPAPTARPRPWRRGRPPGPAPGFR